MPRSIEEIDAEIAEVKARMAQRQAYGYEAARARAVLDHDPSGYVQVNQMMAQAAENKRTRDAQVAAAELQRLFQKEESEKQRKFTEEQNIASRQFQAQENALNRAQNKKVQDRNWYEEQARILRDLRTANIDYQEAMNAKPSEYDKARARNQLNATLDIARGAGIPEEVIEAYLPEEKKTEKKTEKKEPLVKAGEVKSLSEVLNQQQQQQSGQGGNLSGDAVVDLNRTLDTISKAKDGKSVDKAREDYLSKYGEDRSNTDDLTKIDAAVKNRKKQIANDAKVAEGKRAAKEIVSGLQEREKKNKKRLVDDIRSRYKSGIKKWITPEYPGVELDIIPVDDSERNWKLNYGDIVFTVKE